MTTILDVIEKGSHFLAGRGLSDARLNMELLVAHELDCKRMDLYLRFDQPLNDDQLESLRLKLKKRSQHTPLQHITGFVHFGNYQFHCDARALVPRPETEELVDLVLKEEFPRPARILDLGCGSGVLGLTLARELGTDCKEVVLADLSTEALALCEQNANTLKVEASLIESDLFSAIEGSFDLIVANLPYVAEKDRESLSPEVMHDPEMALFGGQDGLDLLRPFSRQCPAYLNQGAMVALEVGFNQGELVLDLLKAAGLQELSLKKDLNGIPRFPLARKS